MVSRNGPLLVIVLVARNFYMTSDYIVVYHVPGAARSLQTHNGSEHTPPAYVPHSQSEEKTFKVRTRIEIVTKILNFRDISIDNVGQH